MRQFPIGGAKVVKQSDKDAVTVIGAGITLAEAVKAHDLLQKEGIAYPRRGCLQRQAD